MSVIVNHDGVAMDRPVVCGHCPVTTVSRGGRILRQYILDYWLDGRFLSVYVYAESWKEAERHVAALRFAKVEGELRGIIPVNEGTAPLIRPLMGFLCWVGERLSGRSFPPKITPIRPGCKKAPGFLAMPELSGSDSDVHQTEQARMSSKT